MLWETIFLLIPCNKRLIFHVEIFILRILRMNKFELMVPNSFLLYVCFRALFTFEIFVTSRKSSRLWALSLSKEAAAS